MEQGERKTDWKVVEADTGSRHEAESSASRARLKLMRVSLGCKEASWAVGASSAVADARRTARCSRAGDDTVAPIVLQSEAECWLQKQLAIVMMRADVTEMPKGEGPIRGGLSMTLYKLKGRLAWAKLEEQIRFLPPQPPAMVTTSGDPMASGGCAWCEKSSAHPTSETSGRWPVTTASDCELPAPF